MSEKSDQLQQILQNFMQIMLPLCEQHQRGSQKIWQEFQPLLKQVPIDYTVIYGFIAKMNYKQTLHDDKNLGNNVEPMKDLILKNALSSYEIEDHIMSVKNLSSQTSQQWSRKDPLEFITSQQEEKKEIFKSQGISEFKSTYMKNDDFQIVQSRPGIDEPITITQFQKQESLKPHESDYQEITNSNFTKPKNYVDFFKDNELIKPKEPYKLETGGQRTSFNDIQYNKQNMSNIQEQQKNSQSQLKNLEIQNKIPEYLQKNLEKNHEFQQKINEKNDEFQQKNLEQVLKKPETLLDNHELQQKNSEIRLSGSKFPNYSKESNQKNADYNTNFSKEFLSQQEQDFTNFSSKIIENKNKLIQEQFKNQDIKNNQHQDIIKNGQKMKPYQLSKLLENLKDSLSMNSLKSLQQSNFYVFCYLIDLQIDDKNFFDALAINIFKHLFSDPKQSKTLVHCYKKFLNEQDPHAQNFIKNCEKLMSLDLQGYSEQQKCVRAYFYLLWQDLEFKKCLTFVLKEIIADYVNQQCSDKQIMLFLDKNQPQNPEMLSLVRKQIQDQTRKANLDSSKASAMCQIVSSCFSLSIELHRVADFTVDCQLFSPQMTTPLNSQKILLLNNGISFAPLVYISEIDYYEKAEFLTSEELDFDEHIHYKKIDQKIIDANDKKVDIPQNKNEIQYTKQRNKSLQLFQNSIKKSWNRELLLQKTKDMLFVMNIDGERLNQMAKLNVVQTKENQQPKQINLDNLYHPPQKFPFKNNEKKNINHSLSFQEKNKNLQQQPMHQINYLNKNNFNIDSNISPNDNNNYPNHINNNNNNNYSGSWNNNF